MRILESGEFEGVTLYCVADSHNEQTWVSQDNFKSTFDNSDNFPRLLRDYKGRITMRDTVCAIDRKSELSRWKVVTNYEVDKILNVKQDADG